jgi:folate-binding protein YgfZ
MATSELTEKLAGARREQYRGADTAAVYSDTRTEFRALTHDAGVYALSWRAKLIVSGKDRVRWLNGMVTNNVRDLPAGHGVYSFLLTPQGRILGDLYTFSRGEFLVIDTDLSQVESLRAVLQRYIIMDKVEIASGAEQLGSIGVAGPKSTELLNKVGIRGEELQPLQLVNSTLNGVAVTIVRGDLPNVAGYELWFDPVHSDGLWNNLVSAGAVPVGSQAFELFRIACGVPRYGLDIRERDLPQETEQLRALNFTKGCYIGQEIVERIRSRGAVHRKFTGFKIEGPLPAPGTKAQMNGKDVAEITSAAVLPTENGEMAVALGYVRREAVSVGTQIEIGNAKGTAEELPFAAVFASSQP